LERGKDGTKEDERMKNVLNKSIVENGGLKKGTLRSRKKPGKGGEKKGTGRGNAAASAH